MPPDHFRLVKNVLRILRSPAPQTLQPTRRLRSDKSATPDKLRIWPATIKKTRATMKGRPSAPASRAGKPARALMADLNVDRLIQVPGGLGRQEHGRLPGGR